MLFAAAALSAQEKGEMQGALEACDSVRECFSRAFEMLLEKLNARGLGAQALEDKRGRRRALEAALETKREELARLQQTFIERNSQYEELLNETLEVNSQLRRQKRRRRKGDKATPKSAKPQKEKEKSSGLFSFIKESFMPGASERSAEKPGAGRQSGKSRPSFVISKAFAREHSQARFEAPGRQAEPSPHKNLRFVEEMGNIDQDLGPEPIFAYNAELSSVRDLWRRSQARRSATLKGFLKAASPGKGEAGAAEGEAGEAAPSLEGILQKRQIEISKRKKNQFFFFKKLNQMFG